MYQQDWILRQIEMLARMLSKLLFHKDTTEYPELDAEEYMQTNLLHQDLLRLIRQGRLNEAENLLFARIPTLNIWMIKIKNTQTKIMHPINPNSSATIENMKSDSLNGKNNSACLLLNKPTPQSPPLPIAYKD